MQNYLRDPVCDNYSVLIVLDADKDVEGAVRPQMTKIIRR
jgi:hypothetical protein